MYSRASQLSRTAQSLSRLIHSLSPPPAQALTNTCNALYQIPIRRGSRAAKMSDIVLPDEVPSIAQLYREGTLKAAPDGTNPPATQIGPKERPEPSDELNNVVALFMGDITTLGVGAAVNAANKRLRGGGGVDGAFHRAAGPELLKECEKHSGCPTGDVVMTLSFDMPCSKIIHTVGPVYHSYPKDEAERLLASCYTKSLQLAAKTGLRSIAFPALSTGIFGYPNRDGAAVALSATRQFLTGEGKGTMDKVIFTVFLDKGKDEKAYKELIPLFFPPVVQD
ncbi:hypothetical protein QBC47DRAFT_371268 [Echria macrotheca]|uniref:Macro domain-containing protein n=1 Tax=Echria macrotheca TaxID=438768 RepID=A0AAJ0BLB7_9PEZI|nr:hypothetical protein QBC47DRAFT_371268 [Echria macrotheca]